MLRKTVLYQSKESVFLCDSSKFSLSAAYNLTSLENVDNIITDKTDIHSIISTNFTGTVISI